MTGLLAQLTDFVWEHQPLRRHSGYDELARWVNWHLCNGFIATVRDDSKKLVGVIVIRTIMEPMDAFEPYKYDYEGKGFYIAELCCSTQGAIKALGLAVLNNYGEREFICYQKYPDYKLQVRSTQVFRRNLFRSIPPDVTTQYA